MIRAFFRTKARSLVILFGVWSALVIIKYVFTDSYLESRFKVQIDLVVCFGLPAGILWDWFDFVKSRKKVGLKAAIAVLAKTTDGLEARVQEISMKKWFSD